MAFVQIKPRSVDQDSKSAHLLAPGSLTQVARVAVYQQV